MGNTVRIPTNWKDFNNFMNVTDDLQLKVLTPPSILRYTLWGWTDEESAQWTDFRKKSNLLAAMLADPDKTSPAAKKNMKILIAETRGYDNNKLAGHRLLNRIADLGTPDDCLTFHIKRGTPLQEEPEHQTKEPVDLAPLLTVLSFGTGYAIIGVRNAKTPKTKKLPEGMVFAKVYCAIGQEQPADFDLYKFVANAKHGKAEVDFTTMKLPDDKKVVVYAYFYGRYESKKGKLGIPGNIVSVEVVRPA
jgi:hypothetical protein